MRQYKFIALLIRSPVLIIAKIVDQLHHLPQDGALERPVTMPPQDVRRIAIRIAWEFIEGLPANVLPHGGAVSVKSIQVKCLMICGRCASMASLMSSS